MKHWDECFNFIMKHRRLPSKYRLEERDMVNWLKYNRKRMNGNKMQSAYAERYDKLLQLCEKYRRINQHAYVQKREGDLNFE